ncbi:hypothetical protein [Lacticaseibacillus saniviri]|uniref:Uncharacterized protein n=1 Tax=Lacticaseibacillus saniviri JCM 17471 = DSM 24301 TaxID=1293598 RepID=A0A0R2MN43_9LACO|nr:hypothetical protein [Lacticaseibacillus saniviri]KRO15121.1 hypothetical protein IV56_GL000209 [Lacticaseibacillus saniviri JCM 17471 = DSM 24301]MCG4282479.1 hypothetical protein [Lacticaseibacillus saniviri]
MKKIWITIASLWAASIIYFIVYANSTAMQSAINASHGLSLLHGVMDLVLILGGFALIARLIYGISHRS